MLKPKRDTRPAEKAEAKAAELQRAAEKYPDMGGFAVGNDPGRAGAGEAGYRNNR